MQPEILDLGPDHYTPQEYHRCLHLLSRINRLLGGFRAAKRALKNLRQSPLSILEVGCGGGYFCREMHTWFPNTRILGIDINPEAIAHAQKHPPGDKLSFQIQKDKTLNFPDNYFDVAISMLVCHHMTDQELIAFIKESYRICTHAVIINDLQRHILAYASFSLLVPFAFPSRLIWQDGRLSVRRSFRKKDWTALLEKAGFKKSEYQLEWNWAFRWTLTLVKQ